MKIALVLSRDFDHALDSFLWELVPGRMN